MIVWEAEWVWEVCTGRVADICTDRDRDRHSHDVHGSGHRQEQAQTREIKEYFIGWNHHKTEDLDIKRKIWTAKIRLAILRANIWQRHWMRSSTSKTKYCLINCGKIMIFMFCSWIIKVFGMSRIAKYQVLLRYFKVYSDIFNLLRLLLALLPKSVWNEAISVHFDPKILLNLSGKHLYDTHEFKFAWKFSIKNSKCTMHIWLTSLTQIFSKFTQIFSIYSDYYWHYWQSLFEI